MKRKRRTRILIDGDPALRSRLAREIERGYSIISIEEPNDGLVMVQVRETAKKTLFYAGEVLVTEAKVQVNGHIGLGIVSGDRPEAAQELAVIDAAFNAALPETERWSTALVEEESRLRAERVKHEAAVARTRVKFESMDDV